MGLYNDFVGDDRYSNGRGNSFQLVLKSPRNFVFVAEDKNHLIGFVTFSVRITIRYPKPIAEVDEIYVTTLHRIKGVGRKLMARMLEQAKSMNCQKVFIETAYKRKNAHKFYKSLGYVRDGYYFVKTLSK